LTKSGHQFKINLVNEWNTFVTQVNQIIEAKEQGGDTDE
jgi:hypothetical protein